MHHDLLNTVKLKKSYQTFWYVGENHCYHVWFLLSDDGFSLDFSLWWNTWCYMWSRNKSHLRKPQGHNVTADHSVLRLHPIIELIPRYEQTWFQGWDSHLRFLFQFEILNLKSFHHPGVFCKVWAVNRLLLPPALHLQPPAAVKNNPAEMLAGQKSLLACVISKPGSNAQLESWTFTSRTLYDEAGAAWCKDNSMLAMVLGQNHWTHQCKQEVIHSGVATETDVLGLTLSLGSSFVPPRNHSTAMPS